MQDRRLTARHRIVVAVCVFGAVVPAVKGLAADALNSLLAPITAKLRSGEPLVFATFGDSITLPCYHTDARQNYITFTVDALRKAYPKADVKIVHAGNMGSTARGLDNTRFQRHVLDHHPDVVFIMFGMNDCGGGRALLDEYEANLSRLVRETLQAGALPIIATQNEIFFDSPDGRTRQALPLYMARALEVSRREKIPAADCFAAWKPLGADSKRLAARLNDGIHPNHSGHRLMAHSMVKELWPEAEKYVSIDERTPPNPEEDAAIRCLIPGPPGKQVLRTENGTWCCVTAHKRNSRITDLVLSYSRSKRPRWDEFRHITLVGARDDAVFDAMDRTLTGAMLLERQGRLHVVFSWNVGVFMLTIPQPPEDTSALSKWQSEVATPAAWLTHQAEPFMRPTIVANAVFSQPSNLYDGYLQSNDWPAVLCSGRKLDEGSGFEVLDGKEGVVWITRPNRAGDEVREMLVPGGQVARCYQATDDEVYYAAQCAPGSPIQLGTLLSKTSVTTDFHVKSFAIPGGGKAGMGLAHIVNEESKNGRGENWLQLEWNAGAPLSARQLDSDVGIAASIPLPWWDGIRQGVVWLNPPESLAHPLMYAYESIIPPGAGDLGVLIVDEDQCMFKLMATK